MSGTTRVAVVGLGSIGSQVLKVLAETPGVEATGFEQFSSGHDRGAAGGDARIFRSGQFEDPAWVPVVQHADVLWDRLEHDTGRKLRDLVGCVFMGPPDNIKIKTAIQGAEMYGLDYEILSTDQMAQRFPQFGMYDDEIGILDKHAGYIRSELTIIATTLLAERLGAKVHRGTRVIDVNGTGTGANVVTEQGSHEFDRVVVTTGPWATKLMPGLSELITIKRPISAWFTSKPDAPLATGYPACIRLAPQHFYAVPGNDGVSVKVGISAQHHKVVDSPDGVERQVELDELDIFRDMLEKYLIHLHPEPVRLQSYFEGYLADDRPIVQSSPESENVIVMVGFSGHGFKLSSAMGEIGANLALGEKPPVDIGFLHREPETLR